MSELAAAKQNISALSSHALKDDQPCVEAARISIGCTADFDPNFEDRTAFISGISKYVEEAQALATLNTILEKGFYYSATIYTWRSLSRGIPAVKSNEQANRVELYTTSVQVLQPEVKKLFDLFAWKTQAITRFTEQIRKLAHPETLKGFVSQATKLTLGRMINVFAVLDTLKNMKACLNNDFSLYKRAHGFLTKDEAPNPEQITMERECAFFLASQNTITMQLQAALAEIDNYEDVLAEIVNECASILEAKAYTSPDDKHELLKVISFSLFLMDGKTAKTTIYKNKKISISRIDKLFKQLPVVPLFGDMHVAVMSFVQASPNFDASKWSAGTDAADVKVAEQEYNIVARLPDMQAESDAIIAQLALIRGQTFDGTVVNMSGANVYDLALKGLRLVSAWTATVRELFVWKLAHPTDKYMNRDCPIDAEAYERATRYNYSSDEKLALIQFIAAIKDVSRILFELQGEIGSAIRRAIHDKVQEFIQITLRDVIRSVTKKKKTKARTVLMGIRNTCADWASGIEPADPALKGDKDAKGFVPEAPPSRESGVGTTQLFMLRTMLESLCIDDKKKSLKGDISDKYLGPMESFFHESFFFLDMLNFNVVLQEASDLSQLWYREFFLELSMGERIQFPIDMSLPWILVSHVLQSKEATPYLEYILYPLDLYNDSANYALTKFKKQFLYDEVEAEVDLCFDQFVYALAESAFAYFKTQASSIMLDKQLKQDLTSRNVKVLNPGGQRYAKLFKQRHFQLLGRSIDIARLLRQRLTVALKKAIGLAISKFESGNLCGILELYSLIENNRMTHQLLSEHIALDPFDEMLAEADNNVTSLFGRMSLHVFAELQLDVIPNMCFNTSTRRFVRPVNAPIFGEGEPKRDNSPKAQPMYWYGSKTMNSLFQAINLQGSGFLGSEHFAAVVSLLGYGGIALVVGEVLKSIEHLLRFDLTSYVTSLLEGMPKECKLPLFDYGSTGALGFYQLRLKDVMAYRDLQTEVFHSFREIGNAVICFSLLEESMMREEVLGLVEAMPFQGIIPAATVGDQNPERRVEEARAKHAYMDFSRFSASLPAEEKELAGKADLLTTERLCKGLSMFANVLNKLKAALLSCNAESNSCWTGPAPTNGVMNVDECSSFYRLWSAIQYTAITSAASSGNDQTAWFFGDGLYWGGCTLMFLLDQQHAFETFDFSYHILKVHAVDQKDETVSGVNMRRFVNFGLEKQELNEYVFTVLAKYLGVERKEVQYFPPPGGANESLV